MEVNGPTVVYGMNSLHVACQEALRVTTPVSEIIAQAPASRRTMWTAATMLKSVVRGKTKFDVFCIWSPVGGRVPDVRFSFRNSLRWRTRPWPWAKLERAVLYIPLYTPSSLSWFPRDCKKKQYIDLGQPKSVAPCPGFSMPDLANQGRGRILLWVLWWGFLFLLTFCFEFYNHHIHKTKQKKHLYRRKSYNSNKF